MSGRLINEKRLIIIMRNAIDEYLQETSFGLPSGYKHGEIGRNRAERLKKILSLDSIWITGLAVWPLILAVYQAGGSSFRTYITTRIAYTGGFGEKLYPLIKENRNRGYAEIEAQERAIKKFVEEQISHPLDDQVDQIATYLNGQGEFEEIKPLIEGINYPKEESPSKEEEKKEKTIKNSTKEKKELKK